MVVLPATKYARSGDVHIAYQVMGSGPIDLVVVPGWVTHVEYNWEEPLAVRFFERLSSFCRLIMFDKRGTGLSDRVADKDLPTLEQRMDDVRAVMDAAGSQRAGDRTIQVEHGRYLAEHIPGAQYVELDGIDHIPFVGDADSVIAQIEEFLTGVRPVPEPD
jgi:pimeloyl-ACP methyl ester carboxylesterase